MNLNLFKLHILVLLWLLLMAGSIPELWAQSPAASGELRGVVRDSVGLRPLEYLTVTLSAENRALKAEYTRHDGSFLFRSLPAGKYELLITGVGYQPRKIAAALAPGPNSIRDLGFIEVVPDTRKLKEVKITASRPVVIQEADRITYDLEADPESKVYSVLEMMKKVPLVSLDADENILLKGNSDFKILINGKPSSMVERNYKDILRSMPASSIVRIEVITTPPAKYDAEGLAGIINIITNRKVDNGYNGNLSLREQFPVGGPGLGGSFNLKLGKIGMSANGGASLYRMPVREGEMHRTTDGPPSTYLFQSGTNKNRDKNAYLGYELSFEPDSLNLLSVQLNINGNRSTGLATQNSRQRSGDILTQAYQTLARNTGNGSGFDGAFNYQRGFKADKNRLLTLSYRYFSYANRQRNTLDIFDTYHFSLPDYYQNNEQRFAEQTLQLDLVYPVKQWTIEAGVKGILRKNSSDFGYFEQSADSGPFEPVPGRSNRFRNTQNVYGVYNTYLYTYKKWSLKAGARIEQTVIDADFLSTESTVRQNYFNVIPSVSLNRRLNDKSGLNLGYTQRIQRPGIYQLNPFVDRSNPSFERTGNPDLKPAVVNDILMNYTWSGKMSVSAGAGFMFFRNLIFQVITFDPVTLITRTSFGNTGSARLPNVTLNINYPVNPRINLSLNARTAYGMVKGTVNGELVRNKGLMYNYSLNTGYKLNGGWRAGASLFISGPSVSFQGTSNTYTSWSATLNKDILKDKFSLAAGVNNPFKKFRKNHQQSFGPGFTQYSDRFDYFQSFHFSVLYKFGKLKDAIRKNKRGIRNDDVQGGN